MFPYLHPPAPCSDPDLFGVCRTTGQWVCATDPAADPVCNAPVVLPGTEICNGQDDDCDGKVDEPCPTPTDTEEGLDDSCVQDAWVMLPVTGTYIYAYEAVRPDAGTRIFDTFAAPANEWSAGKSAARACSRDGVDDGALPWTGLTYDAASDACAAAGARLCTEAEWQEACENPSCVWSYAEPAIDCTVYDADVCNGNDYDPDPAYGDQDWIMPTGWMADCNRTHGAAQVFDMSGNVKEWARTRGVDSQGNPINPVRGGAMDSTNIGISCTFAFAVGNDEYYFDNTGFRCCWGTPPP
jgi:hypothetical protein